MHQSDTLRAEIRKLVVEQRKLNPELGKITRKIFWYPVAIAIGMIVTVSTVTAALIKLEQGGLVVGVAG
ncbi:uncharacterized membrane protein YhaH (DUF805 family) [Pseudomonas frederiksbergensis]|uniref:hypothetical protein n=1 Tax=Pseudomonas frederiksbergensis TaxID=104087 RepID=UPI003D19DDE3